MRSTKGRFDLPFSGFSGAFAGCGTPLVPQSPARWTVSRLRGPRGLSRSDGVFPGPRGLSRLPGCSICAASASPLLLFPFVFLLFWFCWLMRRCGFRSLRSACLTRRCRSWLSKFGLYVAFPDFLVCLPVAHTHFFAICCAWSVAPATICLTELPFALSSHRSPHWVIEPPIARPSHQLHQQATDRTTKPHIARPSHQLHHRVTKCTAQPPIARPSHQMNDRTGKCTTESLKARS